MFFKINNFAKKINQLSQVVLISFISFIIGFALAWVIRTVSFLQLKKKLKSLEGLLESERLIKEKLKKETAMAFQLKETIESELGKKLEDANMMMKVMDQDILLLQKSNEETEALFKITQPEIHALKLKLIEANNAIVRLKSQLTEKR